MDGSCEVCGVVFVDGDAVVHLSFSSWDEGAGCMIDDWAREDSIVHVGECFDKMV